MAEIIAQRMAAEMEGDFVVFLIGMRINKLWKVHKWLPVFLAMPKIWAVSVTVSVALIIFVPSRSFVYRRDLLHIDTLSVVNTYR